MIRLYNGTPWEVSTRCIAKIIAKLREIYDIKAVDCVVVRDKNVIDVRVVFSDLAKMRTKIHKLLIDDKGRSWIRCADYYNDDRWLSMAKGHGFEDSAYKGDLNEEPLDDRTSPGLLTALP